MPIKIIALALVCGLLCGPAEATGTQIWLAGVDPVVRAGPDAQTASDYLNLFQPDAPWVKASEAVQVFKTSARFLANASDETLSHMFADLRRRHIALGMEALMLTVTAKCGAGIEGYSSLQAIAMVVSRIKRLGADLEYVAMDEPLEFGHYSQLPNACQSTLADIANDVAAKVRAVRQIYPNVQVGDIEGIGLVGPQSNIGELMEWTRYYQSAVGTPLSFLHVDVLWSGPWKPQLQQLAGRLRASGIKFGIIYNGDPDDQSGAAWTRHAEQRFAAIEADAALRPDQAILQTWMRYPDHMLPETKPGTMTWLINRYQAAETRLVLHRSDNRLQGELTGTTGQPLGGRSITVSAGLLGYAGAPVQYNRSGKVPSNAATAILALRINAECNCVGRADVAIGIARYHDDRTGQNVQKAFPPLSDSRAPQVLARFQARPGQKIMQNTRPFQVTSDSLFTLQVPIHMDLASFGSGYIALIFLDAGGKEVERLKIPFEPVYQSVGPLNTDSEGRFSLLLDPDTLRRSVSFHAEFPGTSRDRTASTSLQ